MNHCVFFPTEELAQAAGYQPCASCLLMAYANRNAAMQSIGADHVLIRFSPISPRVIRCPICQQAQLLSEEGNG
jgi:hypothetical protein